MYSFRICMTNVGLMFLNIAVKASFSYFLLINTFNGWLVFISEPSITPLVFGVICVNNGQVLLPMQRDHIAVYHSSIKTKQNRWFPRTGALGSVPSQTYSVSQDSSSNFSDCGGALTGGGGMEGGVGQGHWFIAHLPTYYHYWLIIDYFGCILADGRMMLPTPHLQG